MPAVPKQRHFEILRATLALAEERGSVQLDEAAAIVGLDTETLHELLEPVLYLEFRTRTNDIVSEASAFLLTEDGRLAVDREHWLRDLESAAPDPDTALRLLVAGLVVQSTEARPTPDLDRALAKLRAVVAADLRVAVEQPPCLGTVEQAWRDGRSLRFRYVAEVSGEATDREVLPYRVYCKWGHWYLHGREVSGEAPKHFRVDRMVSASLGAVPFDPPLDTEIPDWFDLAEHERTVILRLRDDELEALPRPHRVESTTPLGDGRSEADVTVIGTRRLEHLLVSLEPDTVVVGPPEYRELQRAHASRLLEQYR